LISVNFTMVVQLANFLILLVILNFLLFKPILKVLDEREKLVAESKELQENLGNVTDKNMAEYNSNLLSAKQEAMSLKLAARNEGLGAFREKIQQIKSENVQETEAARKVLESQAAESRAFLKEEANTLASEAASKLLGRALGGNS